MELLFDAVEDHTRGDVRGAGTRLWPVSRDSMPKQFIPLLGEDSTFQRAMRLLSEPSVFEPAIVITNAEYRFTVQDQLQALGISAQIVLEPSRRDSAAAVAVATEVALARDGKAIVGVFAADHIVQEAKLFVETCRRAGLAAAAGRIVTIGIPPSGAGSTLRSGVERRQNRRYRRRPQEERG